MSNKKLWIGLIGCICIMAYIMAVPNELPTEEQILAVVDLNEVTEVVEEVEDLVVLDFTDDITTLEEMAVNLNNRDFRSSMSLEKEVIKLYFDESFVYLQDMAAASSALEGAIESMLASYDVNIILEEMDGQFNIDFEGKSEEECNLLSVEPVELIKCDVALATDDQVMSVEEAIDFITKLKEVPQTYTVQSGDVPSIIAEKNNMGLSELYALNPELASNERSLQIGDDLNIVVPEPELSLMTTELATYEASIPKSYNYQNNEDAFIGTDKTVSAGADGVMEVEEAVAKVNGQVVSRSVTSERVRQEPVAAVVLKGTKTLPVKGAVGTFIMPLESYVITSPFGPRWGSFHTGVDLAAPTGTNIRASDGGVVIFSGYSGTYGNVITIDHGDGVKTKYAHCNVLLVSAGEYVSQYQVIAEVGNTGRSTGPHCHFELLIDGTQVDPMNYVQ